MDLALEFIEKNADKPFCIFVSRHRPHPPYAEAPSQFAQMYSPKAITLRPNVPQEGATSWRRSQVQYFAHVSAMDQEIGRLMRKLAQLGIADDSLVCYSSDHGDMLGTFGMQGKNRPWEEAINVPFVIRWPAGIRAGMQVETLFSTVDATPTLLGLAGVPALPQMQGTDFSSLLKGTNAASKPAGPESVFIMGGGAASSGDQEDEGGAGKGKRASKNAGGGNGWRGVRTPRFTFTRRNAEPWLLYDNEKDPSQTHNLIQDAGYEQTRKQLDAMLHQWQKRVGEA